MTLSLGRGELVPQLNKPWRVQGVLSSYHFVCLKCRAPGENKFFFLGRGHQASFVSVSSSSIPSEFRINDNFKEKIKNEFNNFSIIKLLEFPTAIVITFKNKNGEKDLILSYFEKKLYFGILNYQKNIIRGFLPFQKNPIQDFDVNQFEISDFITSYFPDGIAHFKEDELIPALLPYPNNMAKIQKKV